MLPGFVTRAEKSVKAARLIIENQILHIKSAVFYELDTRCKKLSYQPFKSIEVYISCFGILLNSRVVKFNQGNIDLRAVELGQNYISLTYGTDSITKNAIILHAEINNDEHTEIIHRFRYETGITPTIIQ